MAVIKYNLRENKQLKNRLLYEAPLVASMADRYKNWTPDEPWTGEFAKFESLLKAVGAKPYPRPFGKQANYEVFVGDDYIRFYDNLKDPLTIDMLTSFLYKSFHEFELLVAEDYHLRTMIFA